MSIVVEVAATPPFRAGCIVDVGEVGTCTVVAEPQWMDVTGDIRAFSCRRGRDRDIASVRAGTAELVIENTDGDWTPVGLQQGRWWDQLALGRRFRVSYQVNDVLVRLFVGEVVGFEFAQQSRAISVSVQLQDDLGKLGAVVMPLQDPAVGDGETSAARALRILQIAGIGVEHDINPADGDPLVAFDGGGNAAQSLQEAAWASQAVLYAAADGTITWADRSRSRQLLVGVADTCTSESDVRAGALSLPLAATDDALVNRVTIRSADDLLDDGVASDLPSISLYGPRDLQQRVPLAVQDDVDCLAQFLLAGRGEPDLRFREAEFLVESKGDSLAEVLLSADVGSTVDVQWTPPGETAPVHRLAQVDQIAIRARPGRTTLKWTLSDLTGRLVAQVGSSEFGLVGSSIVGW